jgi:hypothetical protein
MDDTRGGTEGEKVTHRAEIQEEVREIAEVLLREQPPGTAISAVWEEALRLHRVRYETAVLPPPDEGRRQRGGDT